MTRRKQAQVNTPQLHSFREERILDLRTQVENLQERVDELEGKEMDIRSQITQYNNVIDTLEGVISDLEDIDD